MTLILLFGILASSVLGAFPVSAAGNGWYTKRNTEHRQPPIEPAYSYIEQYDAYYVDKRHADTAEDKVLYLTFDAGYENGNITKILDTLKRENVPGAFFVLGHLIRKNKDLVLRMKEEGHLVCNHTMHHRDMTKITNEAEFSHELHDLEALYREEIGGEMARYYRPPEGRFSEENLKLAQKLGYKTVFWSFAYADWDNERQPDPEGAIRKILDHTHNGAVILLHPTSATNAAILPELIAKWREMGYRFGTLDELTGAQ